MSIWAAFARVAQAEKKIIEDVLRGFYRDNYYQSDPNFTNWVTDTGLHVTNEKITWETLTGTAGRTGGSSFENHASSTIWYSQAFQIPSNLATDGKVNRKIVHAYIRHGFTDGAHKLVVSLCRTQADGTPILDQKIIPDYTNSNATSSTTIPLNMTIEDLAAEGQLAFVWRRTDGGRHWAYEGGSDGNLGNVLVGNLRRSPDSGSSWEERLKTGVLSFRVDYELTEAEARIRLSYPLTVSRWHQLLYDKNVAGNGNVIFDVRKPDGTILKNSVESPEDLRDIEVVQAEDNEILDFVAKFSQSTLEGSDVAELTNVRVDFFEAVLVSPQFQKMPFFMNSGLGSHQDNQWLYIEGSGYLVGIYNAGTSSRTMSLQIDDGDIYVFSSAYGWLSLFPVRFNSKLDLRASVSSSTSNYGVVLLD